MRCHLAWAQSFINANGTASPCCAPIDFGNANEFAVSDIYTGSSAQQLRRELSGTGQTDLSQYCRSCYALKKLEASGIGFDVAYVSDLGSETERYRQAFPEYFSNLDRIRAAYIEGVEVPVGSYPIRLEVQLGENCDIRCIMCWQDHDRLAEQVYRCD